jgi:hypothetical protein
MKRFIPWVVVVDADDHWTWECPGCLKEVNEEDPLEEGDIVVCEKCGKEYRVD